MTKIEIQEAIELEIGLIDANVVKPKTTDLSYFWNASVDKFIKTRYSGMNAKRAGFEQDQKRTDDLRTLIEEQVYTFTTELEEYTVTLPDDYMIALGETAYIYSNTPCWPTIDDQPVIKKVDVTEATIENFDKKRNNSLSMHRLHNKYAEPLRVYIGNQIHLYTDGNYYLSSFTLLYLRLPEKLDFSVSPFEEYTELPESTQQELIKLTAHMYLENSANPRYESYSGEIYSME